MIISIHAPARGATVPDTVCYPGQHNFNPRSREGSDSLAVVQVIISALISIHAPARGATSFNSSPTSSISISIHAPARGATRACCRRCYVSIISIHAPARGATHGVPPDRAILRISIHAPARGATEGECYDDKRAKISIHAPARGATSLIRSRIMVYTYFNPRSREGSDIFASTALYFSYNFNPRSREGSDEIHKTYISSMAPFQSTLPRGERPYQHPACGCHDSLISIHAPARGATQCQSK